jgi:ribonucleotide monophosphatase NagD (HAD superfamily)
MRPMTFFIDLDGTIFKHLGQGQADQPNAEALKGSKSMIDELLKRGHFIVLTTGRREHLRSRTTMQLTMAGIAYDELIMNLPSGSRVVVNDQKPDGTVTAYAVSHTRNTTEWGDECLDLSSGQQHKVPEQTQRTLFG